MKVTTCLFEDCDHNNNQTCTAEKVEIDEFLHCSSWRVNNEQR